MHVSDVPLRLLEREHELAALGAAIREAAPGGHGGVVLVHGEAGIGKSSLLEAFGESLPPGGRLLVGYCDDLTTKRTLGPFRDLVTHVGPELAEALRDGSDRDRVLTAMAEELNRSRHPTVLAIEDVHWADDATLDVLRYLARRMGSLPVVLLLTYRDDELDASHPLQGLLGQLSAEPWVLRVPLDRLSEDSVRELAADAAADADAVYAVTAGNPFFVTEVLASGQSDLVPATVVAAVLARVRRLDEAVQHCLAQLSVIPSSAELRLVDALVPGGVPALAPAEEHGVLTVTRTRVMFRHELARRAIVDSLPAARRVDLDRHVLAALLAQGETDGARLVHHAAEAGDVDAILTHAPGAARDAAASGAHREAAAHYRLLLEHRARLRPAELAEILQCHAVECYTLGEAQEAVVAQTDAVDLLRAQADQPALGAAMRWLSRMHWWNGDLPAAERFAVEAISVLEDAGNPRLLALGLSNQSQLYMLTNRDQQSIETGDRAAALAREVDDPAILSHALTNVGLARWRLGDATGQATLDEAIRVARGAGDVEDACRAYVGVVWSLLDDFRLTEVEDYLTPAIELAVDSEFLGFLSYLYMERSRLHLARAAWDLAARDAELASQAHPVSQCPALTVLGRVRVRQGRPGGGEQLDHAWRLAVGMDELQRTGPVAAGRAERAWLQGDLTTVTSVAGPVHAEALRLRDLPLQAELAFWLQLAGEDAVIPDTDHPYALLAAGQWREAARAWGAVGAPYEQALARAVGGDQAALLSALAELDLLGCRPLARVVRSRLREMGVEHVPRGPSETTLSNPAGLTGRQVEVLRLMGRGLTNAEIADRLVVSVRTVDSHVAAVLEKLDAHTRRAAVAHATDLGIALTEEG